MSDYIFELAYSSDLTKIGELTQARGRSLTLSLNKSGAFQMTLPLAHEFSDNVSEIETCVLIRRLGTIVWSGPVWTVEESTPDNLSIGCVGWLQTLEKRVSKFAWGNPLTYTAQDAGAIALDLLTRSNADATSGTNYVTPGTAQTTQSRTKSYQPFTSVLNEIIALSDLESGYDMTVDPISRKLNIYTRVGVTNPLAFFEYGSNAQAVSRSCDSSRLANRFIVYSPVGWVQANDTISQARYGTFEEAISLSDVKDVAILQAYANAELAVRSMPLRFHTFEPRMTAVTPRIFGNRNQDFDVGDTVYTKASRGRLTFPKQAVRVFGATITWPDDAGGQERLTSIQTTASAT
jgi:hypothetical protein